MEEAVTIPRDLAEWLAYFLRETTSRHGKDAGQIIRAKADELEECLCGSYPSPPA